MKTCRRCSWPLTPGSSRGDVHIDCLKCCYCDADLTPDDEPEACRRCMDGPGDHELYRDLPAEPTAWESFEQEQSL